MSLTGKLISISSLNCFSNYQLISRISENNEEIEKLRAKLETESLLKQTAINKLHEIMHRKDFRDKPGKNKVSSIDLRRKEKDLKQLQQELSQEKDKYNQMIVSSQKNIQDLSVFFLSYCKGSWSDFFWFRFN